MKERPLVIYVASPITENGQNGKTVEENIDAASDIALELWRLGFAVICPALNTAFTRQPFNAGLDPEVYYYGDLAIMLACDAIVFTPDWETSIGATREMDFAMTEHIPVYIWPDYPATSIVLNPRKMERI